MLFRSYPDGIQGPEMMVDFEKQAKRMGADIRYGLATKVDFSGELHKVWIDEEKEPLDQSGLLYSELDPRVQEKFLKYDLRFVVYGKEMTDAQAGQTFRLRNETTPVNHQEMLNSYEDNLVAKFVRETSRIIPTMNNTPHKLFTFITNSKHEVVPLLWQGEKHKFNRLA